LFEVESDIESHCKLKEAIFKNQVYLTSADGQKKTISKKYPTSFQKYIIAFVQVHKKESPYYHNLYYRNYRRFGTTEQMLEMELLDTEYTPRDYLFACFKNSELIGSNQLEAIQKILVESYQTLYNFYKGFKVRYTLTDINGKVYFHEVDIPNSIPANEYNKIVQAIDSIRINDEFVNDRIIGVFQKFDFSKPYEVITGSIYTFFKNIFFETARLRVELENNDSVNRRYVIQKEYEMPDGNLINLLFTPEDYWWQDIKSY
jgi:hypothetical protein